MKREREWLVMAGACQHTSTREYYKIHRTVQGTDCVHTAEEAPAAEGLSSANNYKQTHGDERIKVPHEWWADTAAAVAVAAALLGYGYTGEQAEHRRATSQVRTM